MMQESGELSQIQALTKVGHETLNHSPIDASETFLTAYQLAKQTNNSFVIRGCCFNLGACYIAGGEPKLGLRYLIQAIPPDTKDDGLENYADLWYNLGVARHAIDDINEAIVAYKKAQMAYNELSTKHLEGECLSKLAVCYHLKNRLKESCDMYNKAQDLYGKLGDKNNQALCLVSETGVLSQMGDIEECAKVLDMLLDVCEELDDRHLQGKIYHDVGLLYISEKLYESAAECFEQALKCIDEQEQKDKNLQAIVMQNIGAVLNYMKLYERAIYFHKAAGDIYGELGDRRAQTQVFSNLAYAYTKEDKHTEAITAFQHAIQAAKDSRDKESQCLATEGVAAIWFRIKRYKRAVSYYKQALRLVSTVLPGNESPHADRIVEKLADALQFQLSDEGKIAERNTVKQMAEQAHIKKRKGQPRFSKDNRQSLIAKGLEESSPEDSSEQDSDESYDEEYSNESEKDEATQKNTKYNGTLSSNGTNFNVKKTLSGKIEQPKDYDDAVPRADKEYYLASLAQRRAAQTPEPEKPTSKMCSLM